MLCTGANFDIPLRVDNQPKGHACIQMLNGPQYKFAAGVASGLSAWDAYKEAYPKTGAEAARRSASKLMTNPDIKKEIDRIRTAADGLGGSAVLAVLEKRQFLARVVRSRLAELPDDSDLWQEISMTEAGVKRKLPDKLRAIAADNELSGTGTDTKLMISINRSWHVSGEAGG